MKRSLILFSVLAVVSAGNNGNFRQGGTSGGYEGNVIGNSMRGSASGSSAGYSGGGDGGYASNGFGAFGGSSDLLGGFGTGAGGNSGFAGSSSNFGGEDANLGLGNMEPQGEEAGPKVFRHISVHVAPEEPEMPEARVIRVPGSGNKHVNIIFVKAPSASGSQQTEVILPEQDEHKNLVYVLLKKSESGTDIKIRRPEAKAQKKPEVFFIRYKTPEAEQQAPQGASGSGIDFTGNGATGASGQAGAQGQGVSQGYGYPSGR